MNIIIDGCEVRPISEKNLDGYSISSDGRVFRVKEIKSSFGITGYKHVNIREKNFFIHRLVMMAFIGKSSLHVNHKNFIKDDNRLENLEYVTQQENIDWNTKNGKTLKGEKNPWAKLDWAKVLTLHSLYPHKMDEFITDHYSLNRGFVALLIKNNSWSHLGLSPLKKIDKRQKDFRKYVGRNS